MKKYENVYFVNGTGYAGKSTLVKGLAEKYGGIACTENYQDILLERLDRNRYPYLSYTRDLTDWHDFIRRTPDEYEEWIRGVTLECEKIELIILEELLPRGRKIFVDTNIGIETLRKISQEHHVLIMLADPEISVRRFFEREDREKQFLYRLIMEEEDPKKTLENFRRCLERVNSKEAFDAFLQSGFPVLLRDENRSAQETLALAETIFRL